MTELLVVFVIAFAVIAASTVLGRRLGIASPLILVAIGVAASFLPLFDTIEIEPEWILAGVLPPLLYSSAVSMPAMNFRREFLTISGLSVALVIASSLVLGLFFMLVIPDLGFAWGVALGAIISPTDAVATSIVKQTSVSKRVVAILEGESLLNDATALVLLRTAIVATAASFSFWGAAGTFAYSVMIAIIIGLLVGWGNLVIRKRVTDPTVNTVISFVVPFAAAVPTELLGASGLVGAVVAGLITGIRAPRYLSAQNRLSDSQNWRTVELVLEGAVFLTMGVQISSIVANVERDHEGTGVAVLIAAGALVLTILVRAAYVAPLLWVLSRLRARNVKLQDRMLDIREKMSTPEGAEQMFGPGSGRRRMPSQGQIERFGRRIVQSLADITYFRNAPLGWRDGTAVVWAGMRGAVTVAAAQTLPDDTPQRSVLVLIAFAVAVMSLLVQGGTIAALLRAIAPKVDQAAVDEKTNAERARLMQLMKTSGDAVPPGQPAEQSTQGFLSAKEHELAVLEAQRAALLEARDHGTFDADVLAYALQIVDASQIAIEMRGGPKG
ncbi:cation:proton antiporter [Agreia sp.]|uniref:cation:proton antiporter n=1 Tax=Agreia sp. TaxID=1872416 RepID=UPI0035BC88A6